MLAIRNLSHLDLLDSVDTKLNYPQNGFSEIEDIENSK